MQIFLIGFMGSGKTHTAQQLSKILNQSWIDLDDYIEEKGGQTIAKLFEFGGPEQFRKIEKKALVEVMDKCPNHIISTGGGTSVYFNNLDLMKANGLVIYLDAAPEVIFRRIKDTSDRRPLLKSLHDEELKIFIEDLLAERSSFYEQAHIAVEINHSDFNAAVEIAGYLQKLAGKQ